MKFKITYLLLFLAILGPACKGKITEKYNNSNRGYDIVESVDITEIPSLPEYDFSVALAALEQGNTPKAISYIHDAIIDIEQQMKTTDFDEVIESSALILEELNSISNRLKTNEIVTADELESELLNISNAFPELVLIDDTIIEIPRPHKLIKSLKVNIHKLTEISEQLKGVDLKQANKLLADSKKLLKFGEHNITKWEKKIGAHLKVVDNWMGKHYEKD